MAVLNYTRSFLSKAEFKVRKLDLTALLQIYYNFINVFSGFIIVLRFKLVKFHFNFINISIINSSMS